VFSTAGASILAAGYLLPLFYLAWSTRYGEIAGDNPWGATGLEWQTSSPPPKENFVEVPVVHNDPYRYELTGEIDPHATVTVDDLRKSHPPDTPTHHATAHREGRDD
ncbi:MAG: hypothetical protein KDE53_30250, partial [Caldilineaceae bacterium]|nr:hypothetical protein [Caldilineaceae bacterium]